MPSASKIILEFVCPSLGALMANAMFAAPIASLKRAIHQGSLGELNPTPWAFMTGNTLGWVAYAVVTQNLFVLFSNAPGLVISVWLNMGAAKLQYQEMHSAYRMQGSNVNAHPLRFEIEDQECADGNGNGNGNSNSNSGEHERRGLDLPSFTPHEKWVIRVVMGWIIVLSVVCFYPLSAEAQAEIIGVVVNINLVVFYGAPLSTIVEVLRTKNSASIHRRTMSMGFLNAFFWMVYGLAVTDMVIFLPNGCGFLLSVIQVILCVVYKSKIDIDDADGNVEEQLVDDAAGTSDRGLNSGGDTEDRELL